MGRKITIVMYHFVRDLIHSRYPEIKGLHIDKFKGQLDYLKRYYTIIRMEDLISAISSNDFDLPPNALLLTFDDGYIDHFTNVFPIMFEAGVQGSFFPPAKAVMENEVLDVNKIHFILASVEDKSAIVSSLFAILDKFRDQYGLKDNQVYYTELAIPNRFDPGDVIFIKRMLQRDLPDEVRKYITDSLFKKYVTADEKAFSVELYMSMDQLKCMKSCGMFIGSHGYDHLWLDTLDAADQAKEIDLSLDFLKKLGVGIDKWVMCYPYGGYNNDLIKILRTKGCAIGLVVQALIADLDSDNSLALPRLDTNDFPMTGDALPNEWTQKYKEQ